MHIEKNFCDNIINTVMDVPGKIKDDVKARLDMTEMCDQSELNLRHGVNRRTLKPKAFYALSLDKRKGVCEWAQQLTMPDAHCSYIANYVDMKSTKFQNMKSHDCHVFLQTLMPIAFRALPDNVLEPLVELSGFFRNLCS